MQKKRDFLEIADWLRRQQTIRLATIARLLQKELERRKERALRYGER